MHQPTDPFLTDALGAAKWCREAMKLARKKRLNLDAGIYWAARWAAHWAMRSRTYAALP
jgi:hypothetical protein